MIIIILLLRWTNKEERERKQSYSSQIAVYLKPHYGLTKINPIRRRLNDVNRRNSEWHDTKIRIEPVEWKKKKKS